MKLTNKDLKRRIIEISWKHKLSHLGSCLTAVDIIDGIYGIKSADERFVLSSGHAGLALYVVIEKYLGIDAEKIFEHHGVHPDRCNQCHIDCSTGSLGQGLPIAVGMALANRKKNVYCLISDGECSEGSIWEALRIWKRENLINLKIHLNWNNWAAYRSTENDDELLILKDWYPITIHEPEINIFPFMKDQANHYHVMNEEEYKQAMEILK